MPTNLSNLKSKVYKLDINKLVPVNDVVRKDVYNAKIKNIEDKTPDITNLATTNALTAVENKIPNISNLV